MGALGAAHAQDAPRVGLRAGVGISNVVGKNVGNDFTNLFGATPE